MSEIDLCIKNATKNALTHSVNCEKLILNGDLKAALDYCSQQGIEPPQCSLTAKSSNADKMRATAARMMSEPIWWSRRLKNQAMQDFELDKIAKGHVTKGISDESLKHYEANRR